MLSVSSSDTPLLQSKVSAERMVLAQIPWSFGEAATAYRLLLLAFCFLLGGADHRSTYVVVH